MVEMYKSHWFSDAVPTNDLGFTKQKLDEKESDYVTVTIGGYLKEISATFQELGLRKDDKGKRLTKMDNIEFMKQSCDILTKKIQQNAISVWANFFFKSKIPEYYRENYENYQADDLSIEKDLFGMQSRAFSQPNWIIMQQEIIDRNYPSYPIVCVDNENEKVYKPMAVHFHRQLKGNGQIKVESTGILELVDKEEINIKKIQGAENEKHGYVMADYLASLIGKKLFYPDYINHEFFNNINRFESTLFLESVTDTTATFKFNTSTVQYGKSPKNGQYRNLSGTTTKIDMRL